MFVQMFKKNTVQHLYKDNLTFHCITNLMTTWNEERKLVEWDEMPAISRQHFKCLFFNENVWILIEIPLKLVPKCPINYIPALVQIMAWRRPGDKPLSEPMIVCLLKHIIYASLGLNKLTCLISEQKLVCWIVHKVQSPKSKRHSIS